MRDAQEFLFKHKDEIQDLFNKGLLQQEIRKRFNVADVTFRLFCKQHNIGVRTKKEVKTIIKKRLNQSLPIDKIIELYVAKKFTVTEIGNLLHKSSKIITDVLRRNNISVKNGRDTLSNINLNDVTQKYYNENYTLRDIAKTYNISSSTVKRFFVKYNLQQREMPYRHKKYRLPSGKIICIQGFEPSFLDFVFNERLLREEEIQYTPVTIYYNDENGIRRKHYPDFYIPKMNLVVEIKSWWILKKQTETRFEQKKKAILDKGYNFCLVMDNNFTEFKNLINNYEL